MHEHTRPVLMVSIDWIRDHDERRNLGAASIVAELRANKVPVEWLDRAVNDPAFDQEELLESILSALERMGPDTLVGIGCYVWNEPVVQWLLGKLAGGPRPSVVLGGPQISFVDKDELCQLYQGVDWFVRGYGEPAMVAIATGCAENGKLGVLKAGGPDSGRRFDGSLDSLASPWLGGVLEPTRSVRWETQRGCPFRCSFCQHREPNRRHRARELGGERVVDELAYFQSSGVERVSVLDPIFHLDAERTVALLEGASEGPWLALQCRFEMVNERLVEAFSATPVTLEFGLQTTNHAEGKAVGRINKMDKAETTLQQLLVRGVDLEVSLIFGLPEQTLESFKRSVQWCLERGVPRVYAWPLMLLRGTPLQAQRDRYGFTESPGAIPEVVASHAHSERENQEMRAIAQWLRENPGASSLPASWRPQGGVA